VDVLCLLSCSLLCAEAARSSASFAPAHTSLSAPHLTPSYALASVRPPCDARTHAHACGGGVGGGLRSVLPTGARCQRKRKWLTCGLLAPRNDEGWRAQGLRLLEWVAWL
jgi:hypothetical protein